MLDLWAVLVPILLADVVNPVLFAFMVYAAGTDRPLTNSSAALLGHTVTYLGAGILLAFAFDTISDRLANPKPIDFGFGLLVGVAGDIPDPVDSSPLHLPTPLGRLG